MINVSNSSVVKSIDYDRHTQKLIIEYISGSTYSWYPVTPETTCRLVFAESMGRFLGEEISGNPIYSCVRL